MTRPGFHCKDCKVLIPEDFTGIHVCSTKENDMKKTSKNTRSAKKTARSSKKETEMTKNTQGTCSVCQKEIDAKYEKCYACNFYGDDSYALIRAQGGEIPSKTKKAKKEAKLDKTCQTKSCKTKIASRYLFCRDCFVGMESAKTPKPATKKAGKAAARSEQRALFIQALDKLLTL